LWRIGGILISDPFIQEICLTMFHPFWQEEFKFVIFWIKSLLDLSLVFLTIPKEQTYLIYIFSKQSEIDDSNIPNLSHVTN
jgi:hypothetical protein